MSQFETFDPTRLVLYMPTCEKCGVRCGLVRIEPTRRVTIGVFSVSTGRRTWPLRL